MAARKQAAPAGKGRKNAKAASAPAKTAAPLRRHTMTGLEQLRALSHPLRVRLIELFATRAMTTKQAAVAMEQPPTRLYHHVAALEDAGLIRVKETRPNRGTIEKYYEAVANQFEASSAASVGAGRADAAADHAAVGMVLFDQARDELMRALATRRPRARDPIMAVRGVFRLTPNGAKAFVRSLTALVEESRGAQPEQGGGAARRYSLTIALVPIDDGVTSA